MSFFDRLRRLLPARAPADPFARGTRELERGRLAAAEVAFAEALANAADGAEVARIRNKRAVLARQRHDLVGAVAELVLALEADSRCCAAITTTGNLLLEEGAIDEAIAHYEYAILIDDAYGPGYHNLGVALHRIGRKGEAVRMLRKATRLESRMKRA